MAIIWPVAGTVAGTVKSVCHPIIWTVAVAAGLAAHCTDSHRLYRSNTLATTKQCFAMQCNKVHCSVVKFSAVYCSAEPGSKVQRSVLIYREVQLNAVQCSAVKLCVY